MMRKLLVTLLSAWSSLAVSVALAQGVFIPEGELARYGLVSAWWTQLEIDPYSDRLENIALDVVDEPDEAGTRRDMVFIQGHLGIVQAMDAESGRKAWVWQFGSPKVLHQTPFANDQFVAVIDGTDLNLAERATGEPVWNRKIGKVPSQSAVIGPELIYVSTVTGHMLAYPVPRRHPETREWDTKSVREIVYQSLGNIDTVPIVSREAVVWATQRGYLYNLTHDMTSVRYRFDTRDAGRKNPRAAISADFGYYAPYILLGSQDGYVYAVHEISGNQLWQFSAGSPVKQPPVAIGERIFVMPQDGGVYALNAKTGKLLWHSPRGRSWVSGSSTRIYVADPSGRLMILDARTGGLVGNLPTEHFTVKFSNQLTDRIILGTSRGLTVCLRERALATPLKHRLPIVAQPDAEQGAGDAPAKKPPKAEVEDSDEDAGGDSPFGEDEGEGEAMEAEEDKDDAAEEGDEGADAEGGFGDAMEDESGEGEEATDESSE